MDNIKIVIEIASKTNDLIDNQNCENCINFKQCVKQRFKPKICDKQIADYIRQYVKSL
jgi:hypothetical protein